MGTCYKCGTRLTHGFTLHFRSGMDVREQRVCDTCADTLRSVPWITVEKR